MSGLAKAVLEPAVGPTGAVGPAGPAGPAGPVGSGLPIGFLHYLGVDVTAAGFFGLYASATSTNIITYVASSIPFPAYFKLVDDRFGQTKFQDFMPAGSNPTLTTLVKLAALTDIASDVFMAPAVFASQQNSLYRLTHGNNLGICAMFGFANWRLFQTVANVTTFTDSGVAVDTNPHVFKIALSATGATVTFSIDDVTVGTLTVGFANTVTLIGGVEIGYNLTPGDGTGEMDTAVIRCAAYNFAGGS